MTKVKKITDDKRFILYTTCAITYTWFHMTAPSHTHGVHHGYTMNSALHLYPFY
ncbi:MAG: hypothetical protein JNJ41_00235 [Bacteroidia bacterium]|nr:hypothetical protein [Bacteroidia bacterium]